VGGKEICCVSHEKAASGMGGCFIKYVIYLEEDESELAFTPASMSEPAVPPFVLVPTEPLVLSEEDIGEAGGR
jgi:hypothetical protein